jgi:hypothetical protein
MGWSNVDVKNSISTSLLTISASFREEVTADGRSDRGAASVFKLDNIFYPSDIIDFPDTETEQKILSSIKTEEDSIWRGDWADLRELTSATFAIDALISCWGNFWNEIKKLIVTVGKDLNGGASQDDYYGYIKNLLFHSYEKPDLAGIETDIKKWPTESLMWGIDEIEKWQATFRRDPKHSDRVEKVTDGEYYEFYSRLITKAESELARMGVDNKKLLDETHQVGLFDADVVKKQESKLDEARIRKAIPLAILIAIHKKLDGYRAKYRIKNTKQIKELFEKIESLLHKHSRFSE